MSNRRSLIGEAAMAMSSGGGIDTNNYLTMVALEDGLMAKLSTNTCEYCVDGDGNWKTLPAATNTEAINTGQTLSFRGNLTPVSYQGIGTFTISKSCNLEGNCMSMLFGDAATSNTSLSGKNYAFYYLFKNCTTIKSVSSRFLPATTLGQYCYTSMFYGCTSLTTAPSLPATTLYIHCYQNMFYGCTSLTTAPSLPATTSTQYCYASMFYKCTSLTKAPELPATNLNLRCYYNMFYGCTSLTQAPSILPAKTLQDFCCSGMFQGCTSLTKAPALPATTVASGCYEYMFYGCSKLNYIKAMFTTKPGSFTSSWVQGVSSTGTFVKNKKATWNVTGTSGIPSGWTVQTV